jgi:hypothetical protein
MSISLPFAAVSDVSRASEISVGMYLRSSPPSSTEETGMGNSDIFLGGIKVLPDFTVRPGLPSPMAVDSCVLGWLQRAVLTRKVSWIHAFAHRTSRIPTSGTR